MDTAFQKHLEKTLQQSTGCNVEIISVSTVGGGCINHAQKLKTTAGDFFIKKNNASSYPGMFEAEAKGLKLLADTNAIHIPHPIATGVFENTSFIIIEHINSAPKNKNFWKDFGKKLATLHKITNDFYGLDHDNYIGSLQQKNKQTKNWITFFIEQRLQVQLQLAESKGKINSSILNNFERLFKKLPDLITEEKPSLLHGDLWSGNFMINEKGVACLIDPSVYFGHREADLAMTHLFSGFDDEFYESYYEEWPLENNYYNRFDIYNLYPLLVHVNLFGGGYLDQVKYILRRFV
ncbi:MAG: fructosamine kinase family protein [Bacteroidia bacterium]